MRRARAVVLVGAVVGALLSVAPAADAGVLTVTKLTDDTPDGCTKDDCSLREAILKANKTKKKDKIVLGPGVHQLTIAGADEDGAAAGDLDLTRSVKVFGQEESTTIKQTVGDRVFDVLGKAKVTMNELRITGGDAEGSGGGVLVGENASLHLSVVMVDLNSTDDSGGAIATYGGVVRVEYSELWNNAAPAGGGGAVMADGGRVTLLRSWLEGNDASYGGAIYADAPIVMEVIQSDVSSNESAAGGGIFLDGGNTGDADPVFTMRGSSVSDNGGDAFGGGLVVRTRADQPDAEVSIEDSTISGNGTAGEGGGIYCTCLGAPVHLSHVTITDNTADADNNALGAAGGGIFTIPNGNLEMRASIVAANFDIGKVGNRDCGGEPAQTLGANVFGDESCAAASEEDLTSDGSFLEALTDNGGWSLTHALDLNEAPLDIDTGTSCGGTDARGVPRPQGDGCDPGHTNSRCATAKS